MRRLFLPGGTYSGGPQLFSPTRLCESDICAKENRQCISTPAVFSWARVDYASRAAKNSPLGCFCAVFCDSAAAVRIHPWICFEKFQTKEKLQHLYDAGVLGGRGWIRTTEAEKQQIYSLSPLATREHAHILFVSVAGRLVYFIIGLWICQPLFSFLFFFCQYNDPYFHARLTKAPSEKSYSFIKFCNIVNILYFFGGQVSGGSATIVFVLSRPLAGGGSFTHKQEELSCSKKSFT